MSTTQKSMSPRAIAKLHSAISPTGCARPESLFGLWSIEPRRFDELVAQAKSVDLVALAESRKAKTDGTPSGPLPTLSPERPGKKKARADDEMPDAEEEDSNDPNPNDPDDDPDDDDTDPFFDDDDRPYQVVNGIAVLSISGPMTKYETSFHDILGGTATVPLRRAIRMAARDPEVNCAVFCIDSPGGTAAGMTDLASDIRFLNAEKPCYAYISDMGCSAAYWAASQCDKVYCNDGALVGCIGTMAVLRDTSKAYQQQGVTVHVITSDVPEGQTMKGAGADGTEITPDQLADFKRQINEQNDLFVADVAAGREMTPQDVRALADGRVHVGAKARQLGLVDEVCSFDAAMQAIYTENYQMTSEQFKAFAAANPDDTAVKSLIASGHKPGKAEGRAEARSELQALIKAFPGREQFAAEQFAKGNDVLAAKAELADVLAAENEQLRRQSAQQIQAAADAAAARRGAGDNPAVRTLLPGTTQAPGGAGAGGDPIKAFNDAWQAHTKAGMTPDRAIAKVVREQPELHDAFLAAQPSRERQR